MRKDKAPDLQATAGTVEGRYVDFSVRIESRARGRYRSVVPDSATGAVSAEFKWRWEGEDPRDIWRDLASPLREREGALASDRVRRFGARLFREVLGGRLETAFRSSLKDATVECKRLRLRLSLREAPELSALPWEYLYDEECDQFLALSQEISIVRQPEIPLANRPLEVEPPIRVLAFMAAPIGMPRLEIQREWESMQRAFEPLIRRGRATLERVEHGTLAALRQVLSQGGIHVFHFLGHGVFDPGSRDGFLVLEDEQGHAQPVNGQRLGALLATDRALRLVVLNACDGARTSASDPLGGVAERLVRQGIPAVVAMQYPISDRAAIAFAHQFYDTLATSGEVDAALAQARMAMVALEKGEMEWGAPVLYLRSRSGRLFRWMKKPLLPPGIKAALAALVLAGLGAGFFAARDLTEKGKENSAAQLAPAGALVRRLVPASNPLPTCPELPGFPAMEFLRVPPGQGMQRPLCVGKFEVREAEWGSVMGAPSPGASHGVDYPVTFVSFEAAREFTRRLSRLTRRNVRLLTREEWEHVARAGTKTLYFFGGQPDEVPTHGNCQGKDRFLELAPAGRFSPNPWGFHDVYGNVWEWVEDRSGKAAQGRLRCGGSFDIRPKYCNSKNCTESSFKASPASDFGFRVAYEPDP